MSRGRYRKILVAGFALALLTVGLAPAGASSANISHSYHGTGGLHNGSMVSLDPARSDYVEPANLNNSSKLLGVAVDGNDSLIAVDPSPGLVQVATSGNASVLVSTLNGDINVGDAVAVSPFDGVGMKAVAGSRTVGLAQTSFNGSTSGAVTEQVKQKNGKTGSIRVGYVKVNIAIGTNAGLQTDNLTSLQKFAKNITGHVVSTSRIIISLAVTVVAMLALVTLIYASIYGSIVSVGRNPLAKYAVFRTLGSVLAMALLTTVIAAVIVYFLLR